MWLPPTTTIPSEPLAKVEGEVESVNGAPHADDAEPIPELEMFVQVTCTAESGTPGQLVSVACAASSVIVQVLANSLSKTDQLADAELLKVPVSGSVAVMVTVPGLAEKLVMTEM
ncbi:MAG: hypothetical protein ABIR70_05215 [Bryobacteraceae bacterium]